MIELFCNIFVTVSWWFFFIQLRIKFAYRQSNKLINNIFANKNLTIAKYMELVLCYTNMSSQFFFLTRGYVVPASMTQIHMVHHQPCHPYCKKCIIFTTRWCLTVFYVEQNLSKFLNLLKLCALCCSIAMFQAKHY